MNNSFKAGVTQCGCEQTNCTLFWLTPTYTVLLPVTLEPTNSADENSPFEMQHLLLFG